MHAGTKLWYYAMFIVGGFFLLIGLAVTANELIFSGRAVSATGTISKVDKVSCGDDDTEKLCFSPTISFTTNKGASATFEGNIGNTAPPIGHPVKVLYDPSQPKIATIDSAMSRWWATIIFLPLGLLIIVAMRFVRSRDPNSRES